MAEQSSYFMIIRKIDENTDLYHLTKQELDQWEKELRGRIDHLSHGESEEDLAVAVFYLLIFLLKSKRIHDSQKIDGLYETMKRHFLEEERGYHRRMRQTKNQSEKKLSVSQFLYFYKLVEFYLTYLEKTLHLMDKEEVFQKVYRDKMHFLQKHQLLEGNIKKYLSYSRIIFHHFMRKYLFLYALLSGAGVVLLWHGLWGLFDVMVEAMGFEGGLMTYLFTTSLGVLVLYILGLFMNQTIGDKETLVQIEEEELKDEDELQEIEKVVKKRMTKSRVKK